MADQKITFEIATPEKLVFSEPVDEVVLPSADGYMGVRYGHAPLLCQLDTGEISCKVGGTEKTYAVSGGFAEVLRDGVQVLAQTCEPGDGIDVERAKRSLQRAEERMKAHADEIDFGRAEASLKRAISRIAIHARVGGGR